MAHFEQITACRTAVDNLKQAVLFRATPNALKPRLVTHGYAFSARAKQLATTISFSGIAGNSIIFPEFLACPLPKETFATGLFCLLCRTFPTAAGFV
jgi:hypothetical protein